MLSMNEYAVLDSIYQLSNNKKFKGWCIKSKESLAKDLDLSERTIHYMIEGLVKKTLIIKNKHGHLRPCEEYCTLMAEKSDIMIGVKTDTFTVLSAKIMGGANIAPNIYIDNNKDNNIDRGRLKSPFITEGIDLFKSKGDMKPVAVPPDAGCIPPHDKAVIPPPISNNIQTRSEQFLKKVNEAGPQYPQDLRNEFVAYWTEHNDGGLRMRFEMEKVFDITRRLATWKKNENSYKPPSWRKPEPEFKDRSYTELKGD